MACQHLNPVGYLFCSACGQPLDHQRCLCGFVCAADALYCGRCGHSLTTITTENEANATSALEHRYDLDMLVQLAGVAHKKSKVNGTHIVDIHQNDIKPLFAAMQKGGVTS